MRWQQGYKTVYTLVSPDLSYTAKLPVFFKDVFEKGGGKEIGTDTFSIGQPGLLRPGDQDRRSRPPTGLHLHPMFTPDIGIFLKQLRAAGVTTPVLGADGYRHAGPHRPRRRGRRRRRLLHPRLRLPGQRRVEDWVNGYTAWKGKAPESNALGGVGCDCIDIIKAAVEAAGSHRSQGHRRRLLPTSRTSRS